MVLLFDERIFEMTAQQPEAHIKEPYTLAEIKAKIASNDYNAEILLQHSILLLDGASISANVGEPTKAQIREVFMSHGFMVKEGQTDLKPYVYDAAYALLALAAHTTQAAPQPADVAGAEHELKDVRCECCGYMTYHREHTGCMRAAYAARAARNRINHD